MQIELLPQIMTAFAASEAGQSLKETYRWSMGFRKNESNRRWEKIFGVTAVDFKHGVLMYNIGRIFLEHEQGRFTPEQEEIFLYGLLTHDWGEAKINGHGVGDVSAQIKTAKDEKGEMKMFPRVIKQIKLPEDIKAKLVNGYEKVVEGGDPALFDAFKALEKTEYVITAMKVFQNCERLREKKRRVLSEESEQALVGRVLIFDLARVLDTYAPAYPESIGLLFKNSSNLIDSMLSYSRPWLEKNKEWMGKPVDHEGKAIEFESKWEAFKRLSL
jgi:hypothetical protein